MSGAMDSASSSPATRTSSPTNTPAAPPSPPPTATAAPTSAGPPLTRNHLPFGALLDLSGFWFRPTRLAAWAETIVVADTSGPARLRLATAGGAVLFLNGTESGHLAPYTRNKEAGTEIALTLPAGEARLTVSTISPNATPASASSSTGEGPPARQGNPFDASPAVVAEVEAALNSMHFERAAYHGRSRPHAPARSVPPAPPSRSKARASTPATSPSPANSPPAASPSARIPPPTSAATPSPWNPPASAPPAPSASRSPATRAPHPPTASPRPSPPPPPRASPTP